MNGLVARLAHPWLVRAAPLLLRNQDQRMIVAAELGRAAQSFDQLRFNQSIRGQLAQHCIERERAIRLRW